MNFTLDANKKQTSMSGLIVVTLHVAIVAGLVYGLEPASLVFFPTPDVVYVAPAIEPPKPVEPLIPPVIHPQTTQMRNPVIPLITPPDIHVQSDALIVAERVADYPPAGAINRGNTEQGSANSSDSMPAAVTVAAVVDAKSCEKPEYPRTALRNEYTGTVTLALLVGLDGKVADSKIEKSSGHRELDQAAVAGLSLCKFKPASINGQPQKTWAKMQYVWSLDS